jgi:hypothetical protein
MHALQWKHRIFGHLPNRNPETDENEKFCLANYVGEIKPDVPKMVGIGWLHGGGPKVR